MAFVLRSLEKRQAGQGVNALGKPEIPKIVFEELIANALIHRDYFVSAPIRLFVYRDRIELISPGHLPNHLTIQKIEAGNSNIRNPTLASFAFKGILPYRGLGTGIRRALTDWPNISFVDDKDGNQFKVTIFRSSGINTDTPISKTTPKTTSKTTPKTRDRLLTLITENNQITREELSERLGIGINGVKQHILKLKKEGALERLGDNRTGFWKIMAE